MAVALTLRDAITTEKNAITTVIGQHQHRIKPLNPPKALKRSLVLNLQDKAKVSIQLAMWVHEEELIGLHLVAGRTTTAADELSE